MAVEGPAGAPQVAPARLLGRRAVVTGAGGGIGEGIVRELRGAGAQVVCADRRLDAAKRVAADWKATAISVDVTDEASVTSLADSAAEALGGGIDLLVNNAGILTISPLIDLPADEWDQVMAVNARGTFLCCKVFGRRMISAGQCGSIVNISSISGRRGTAGVGHYCASKFAVIGLTQTAADEFGAHGITVNAVCPGHVRTPMLSAVSDGLETPVEDFVKEQLIKVPQEPRDIGEAVVFLAAARNVTGQSLNVDGGWHLG